MQKLTWFLFFSLLFFNTGASGSLRKQGNELIPPGWEAVKIKNIAGLTAKQFEFISGKKMNFKERLVFLLMKGKMKKQLKMNPDLTMGGFMATLKGSDKVLLVMLIILGILGIVVVLLLRQI